MVRPNSRANYRPNQTMPKTTVNQGSNGQYKTTVPKQLAEALNLDGKTVEWKVESSDRLSFTVTDE